MNVIAGGGVCHVWYDLEFKGGVDYSINAKRLYLYYYLLLDMDEYIFLCSSIREEVEEIISIF